ncbi:hemicentin-1, partial [Elysia marginata]
MNATSSFIINFYANEMFGTVAYLSADPMKAVVNVTVTLECSAFELANMTEVPIANVTWKADNMSIGVTQDNKINVTSATVGKTSYECTAVDVYGRNATAYEDVLYYENVTKVDMFGIVAYLSADPMKAVVNVTVTLECSAFELANMTEVSIANVTWKADNMSIGVTQDNKINVTSATVGKTSYECTAVDVYGRNATAYEDVLYYENATEATVIVQCTVSDGNGMNATSSFIINFYAKEQAFSVQMSATPAQVTVNSTVTLECEAYETGNGSIAVTIANVSWLVDGAVLQVTQDNQINVTAGSAGDVQFTCTVVDDVGRNASASSTVTFLAVNDTEVYEHVQAHISANTSKDGAAAGSTVEVQCWPHLGRAPFSISWRNDGVAMANQTGNYLYVTSASASTVIVQCTVSDGNGMNATSSFIINFYAKSCSTGQGYSWVQAGCAECDGQNEYNDGGLEVCAYCRYTTARADACDVTDPAKTTAIGKKDICITSTLWSMSCDSSTITLAQINTQLSKDARAFYLSAFPSSSGLCANGACENVVVSVARKSLACQACNSTECGSYNYKTTAKACLYDVDEFVNTGVNSVLRRAQEVFLESLRDVSQFPANANRSTTFMTGLMVSSPPVRVESTTVPESENRELLATFRSTLSWSSNYQNSDSTEYQSLNSIIQDQLPPMFGQSSNLLYVTITATNQYTFSQSNFVAFTLSFVFRQAIATSMVEAVSEIGILSHSISSGRFGSSSFSFQSEVHVFRSQSDMQSGQSAVVWCTYLETLSQSVSLTYCDADSECRDTSLWYE